MLKSREELLETEVALVPPDGGTGEGPLLVGSEFHPDEENQRKIAACLADNPIPGVELLPFHPLAASEELRYVHRAQLSEWFTGNLEARTSGDPDEAAAGWVSPEVTEINPWLLVVTVVNGYTAADHQPRSPIRPWAGY